MFKEIAEPRTSKYRRWWIVLSVLYLGIAIADGFRFWYRHDSLDAINAVLWLVVAVASAYRSRHLGEPRITKLGISASGEPHEDE